MPMKTAAVQILERHKLPYELREYEEEELSADEAARKLGLPLARVFKTLVAQGDRTGVLLACLPGSHIISIIDLTFSMHTLTFFSRAANMTSFRLLRAHTVTRIA